MATQTSLVAQQVRIRQWAEQIRNCQNRPKGMDVETWCCLLYTSTAAIAKEFAESEFEKYRVIQDSLYESDFDKLMNDMELSLIHI